MNRRVVLGIALIFLSTEAVRAASLSGVRWSRENLQAIRSLHKDSIQKMVNELREDDPLQASVGGFGWYDLANDGTYSLVVTEDLSGRSFFDYLAIYTQDPAGKVALHQWIEASNIGTNLGGIVRDLNNDSKYELILPQALVSFSHGDTFTWPAVYKIHDQKYVEASRDFAKYYDKEVLPQLEKRIGKDASVSNQQDQQARPVYMMERDKILRVLGRNPEAGLESAREWIKSDDPRLLQLAAATFQDIGGHEDELKAATAALVRVSAQRSDSGS